LGPSTTFSGEASDIRESVTVYDDAAFNTLFIGVRSLLLNNEPDAAIEFLDTHPEFYMAKLIKASIEVLYDNKSIYDWRSQAHQKTVYLYDGKFLEDALLVLSLEKMVGLVHKPTLNSEDLPCGKLGIELFLNQWMNDKNPDHIIHAARLKSHWSGINYGCTSGMKDHPEYPDLNSPELFYYVCRRSEDTLSELLRYDRSIGDENFIKYIPMVKSVMITKCGFSSDFVNSIVPDLSNNSL
tara:strand:- start:66 stop:785 length:720 start_codon:yes stop_codon:yes gene_type:complete